MSWEDTIRKGRTPEDYREMDARDAMNESSHARYIDKRIKQVQEDLVKIKDFIFTFYNIPDDEYWKQSMEPSVKAFDNLNEELERQIKEYHERMNYQGD
tara:strand:- start:166 stop:462 length:297 start_codon:yes stop_codon:yes gene_type:complete